MKTIIIEVMKMMIVLHLLGSIEQMVIIIHINLPTDVRVGEKEREKVAKYQDFMRKISRLK